MSRFALSRRRLLGMLSVTRGRTGVGGLWRTTGAASRPDPGRQGA